MSPRRRSVRRSAALIAPGTPAAAAAATPLPVLIKLAVTVHQCLNGRLSIVSVGALHPGLQC